VRGVTWQVKTAAVVDDDTVYMTAWAPGADASARKFFPPFEEVAKIADADGDLELSPEEIPEEMRHTGSWTAIDLDADGYMGARDWGFYRARWSSRNVTLAVRPGGARGDLTDSHVVWEYERGVPVVSSPLLYRGTLHTVKDGGIWTAFEAKTGKVLKQGRLRNAIDKYYSSPVAGDGKIYILSETGKASVMDAAADWDTLQVNELGEPTYATPAIADGTLYIRTATTLYAFRKMD
jgi:outer membrane protein assembly factor BamB